MIRLALLSIVGVVAACDARDADPPLAQIHVDACATGIDECALHYDSIPSTQTVEIANPGRLALHLFSVETTNGTFSLEHGSPAVVDPGSRGVVDVTASSRSANARLQIVSDAKNTPLQPDDTSLVEVALIVR